MISPSRVGSQWEGPSPEPLGSAGLGLRRRAAPRFMASERFSVGWVPSLVRRSVTGVEVGRWEEGEEVSSASQPWRRANIRSARLTSQ